MCCDRERQERNEMSNMSCLLARHLLDDFFHHAHDLVDIASFAVHDCRAHVPVYKTGGVRWDASGIVPLVGYTPVE